MSAAGACNRPFPDTVELHPDAALRYDGGTLAEVLHDAAAYGGKWRMVAVAADGRTLRALTEWCAEPAAPARPAAATATDGLMLARCWCDGASNETEYQQGGQP